MKRGMPLAGIIAAKTEAVVASLLALCVLALPACRSPRRAAETGPAPDPAPSASARPVLADSRPVLLFLGTSLTAGLGLLPEQAYPALIQQRLDLAGLRYRVVNAGVSGETSAGALRRIDWVLRQPVAVLVIETGANDGLRGQEPQATRDTIQAIIDAARRRQPPPRLVLVAEFTRNLRGYPVGFSALNAEAFSLLPVDSRAAFPSLHTAASTVALVYAWRHVRWWAFLLAPFVVGLWVSTIYLRHHYFVDLLAGWALAPLAMWVAPRADGWWARQQRALGYEPARGA